MRWTLAIIAVGLAVGIGVMIRPSLASPSAISLAGNTQSREDQITLGATGEVNGPTYYFVPLGPPVSWASIDPADYPASTSFRLEVIIDLGQDTANCVRLFDLTSDAEISGSAMCASGANRLRLRSDPLTLPVGAHDYALQGYRQSGDAGSDVMFSRIIAEWSETSAGASQLYGDANCDGAVNSVDALLVLRWKAGLSVNQVQPCPTIGTLFP
jgi:hypothetical protein